MAIIEEDNSISYPNKIENTPFLLSLKIFGKKMHNCLVDSGALGNAMPYAIW